MSGPKLPFMCLDSFRINSIFFFSFLLTLFFKLFYFLVSLLLIFLVGLSKEISESCGAGLEWPFRCQAEEKTIVAVEIREGFLC